MSDIALRMDHVYKKFRKGEVFTSLRDLVPALTGRMFRQGSLTGSDKREFWALHDVSFEVKPGEALGIIGSNGAGKSTILKILSRIMNPTQGQMVVNGRLSALIEVAAGFHQDLTGRENIYLNGTILGMTRQEIDRKLDQIIAFSGIEDFIDTPVKRYSSGMYARLGFSVAAHVDPDVLIVDEVLSVGDYAFQQRCMERMKEITRAGVAVLFVSHNLRSVAEFCERCLLLDHGRVGVIGPSEEVVRTYTSQWQGPRADEDTHDVRITHLKVRNDSGECHSYLSGEKAWIDIEVTGHRPAKKLSLTLCLIGADNLVVMDTSTERLGHGSFGLESGEVFRCTFELDLNLVGGTFDVAAYVFRYDSGTVYDRWMRAARLFIATDRDVRGVANCFPLVVRREIGTSMESARDCSVVARS